MEDMHTSIISQDIPIMNLDCLNMRMRSSRCGFYSEENLGGVSVEYSETHDRNHISSYEIFLRCGALCLVDGTAFSSS
jgi:hypothetical protein